MSSRSSTPPFALATNDDGRATGDEFRRLILRWVVVVGQAATLLVTYRLWQVRESVPNLPLFDLPTWLQFAPFWPLLASLAAVLVRPLIGIALHTALLLVAIALDQMRIQPEVISLAILLWATLPWRGARMIARAHLIALWFYAGLHKLLSPAYWNVVGPSMVERTFPGMPHALAWGLAVAVALMEIALAVLVLWPKSRKIAGWSAAGLHVAIFLGLAIREWNEAIWAWNLVLAAAGPLLFVWWNESTWVGFQMSRRAVQATIAFLLISPAGYYLGWIDAYLAHCLYASNTPQAEFVPSGEDAAEQRSKRLLGQRMIVELNVPFPPAHRLYEQYFREVGRSGDQLRITDRRRWAGRRGLSNRVLTIDGEYRDGKKHGRWQAWHPDGSPAEVGSFRHGLEHGQWTIWDTDGTKLSVTYENGKQIAVRGSQRASDAPPAHSP
jgi:hypothetical protein